MFKKLSVFIISLFVVLLVVSCGQTTTTTQATTIEATTTTVTTTEATTVPKVTLPDLSGMSKTEIKTALDNLSLGYTFTYQTNTDIDEDNFIEYGNNLLAGDEVSQDLTVVIVLATPRLVLPDLTGMTQSEVITALLTANITFNMVAVNNNDVPDQTFVSYGDNLKAGDLVPSKLTVIVNIGFNSPKLPDLTGLVKEQIVKTMNDMNIPYEFQYVTDDEFAEDTFAGYKDMNIGDFYTDGTVVIDLYKNTFTDNETSLFISQYIDGGDDTSNQAIEIYNPTEGSIDLSDYYIAIFINGSYTADNIVQLPDISLMSGENYVIVNSGADLGLIAKADLTSDAMAFDGNDTIQLCYKNGTYIDTIYNLGNKSFIMDDQIFVRDSETVKGTRTYAFNQWHGYVPDYYDIIGTFPVQTDYEIPFTFIDRPWDDPLGGMDNVTPAGIADGDTVYFTPGFLGDERVRFLGVDTPETYPRVDPWGPEAKEYTTTIINAGIDFYIQSDPDMGLYGNYGRSLGLVWVNLGSQTLDVDIKSSTGVVMRTEHLTGWILLNYHLILNGYSYNYYGNDTTLTMDHRYIFDWFADAERFATANGLGVHE